MLKGWRIFFFSHTNILKEISSFFLQYNQKKISTTSFSDTLPLRFCSFYFNKHKSSLLSYNELIFRLFWWLLEKKTFAHLADVVNFETHLLLGYFQEFHLIGNAFKICAQGILGKAAPQIPTVEATLSYHTTNSFCSYLTLHFLLYSCMRYSTYFWVPLSALQLCMLQVASTLT